MTATGGIGGIYGNGGLTVSGGTVTAKGEDNNEGKGIVSVYDVTISGGTVTADGGQYGISGISVTIKEGSTVIASGNTRAISGTVKNAVSGARWGSPDGVGEKAIIDANDTGGELAYYRKDPI